MKVSLTKKMGSAFLSLTLFLCGCVAAQKITYPLNDIMATPKSSFSRSALFVKELEDLREPVAKAGSGTAPATVQLNGANWFYNSDDHYEHKVVAPWITQQMARHLEASHLFASVEADAKKTADSILEGRIKKFDAFKKTSAAATGISSATMMFGAIGGAIGGLMTLGIKTDYLATTVLELKLTELSTQRVLWEGEVEGRIEGSDPADVSGWTVYQKANLSLKKAVDNLIAKLNDPQNQYMGRLQPAGTGSFETHTDRSDRQEMKAYIVKNYDGIVKDLQKGPVAQPGEYLTSLLSLLKVSANQEYSAIKRIRELSAAYPGTIEFADHVIEAFGG